MALLARRAGLLLVVLVTAALLLEALYIDVTSLLAYVVRSPGLSISVLVVGGFLAGRWLDRSALIHRL